VLVKEVLVNDAGINTIVPTEETTLSDWNRDLVHGVPVPFVARTTRRGG
jgi:hypothetical protein